MKLRLFDSNDRNYLILYPDGGAERRWYDAAGNLTKVCLPEQYNQGKDDGAGYVYEYDCRNRLTQITAPDGTIQKRYVYDQRGNITKVIDAKGMKTGDTDTGKAFWRLSVGGERQRYSPHHLVSV